MSERASPAAPWPGEIELLLSCARAHMETADVARAAAAIGRGVDWARVITYARAHHVVPLLRRHAHAGRVVAPAPVVARLDEAQRRIAQRNLRLSRALLDVLDLLASAGIAALPLKGPVLAQQVYGSVAMRVFGDLDVLVAEARIDEALGVLLEAGYVRRLSGASEQESERRHSHHIGLVGPRGGVALELHQSLISKNAGFRLDWNDVVPHLTAVDFMGRMVPALTPEALTAYLCQHGAEHAWNRIEWMATANECVRRVGIDDVRPVAERFGAAGHVSAALELFDGVLGSPASTSGLSDANAMVCAGLSGAAPAGPSLGYAFRSSADWRLRARRMFGVLMTPHTADARAVPVPRGWAAAYYLVRPVRLILRGIAQGRRPGRAMER